MYIIIIKWKNIVIDNILFAGPQDTGALPSLRPAAYTFYKNIVTYSRETILFKINL